MAHMTDRFLNPPTRSVTAPLEVSRSASELHDQSVFPGEVDFHEKTPSYAAANARLRTTPYQVDSRSDYVAEMLTTGEVRRAPKIYISAARRERCRLNQARYRDRQRQREEELSDNVNQLQQEIQVLEAKRQELDGYTAPTVLSEKLSPSLQGSHAQLDFMKAIVAPDVTDGSMSGAETLLKIWRRMSLHDSDTDVQPRCLNEVAKALVLATATISLTITEQTLLNQRLEIQGSMRFD